MTSGASMTEHDPKPGHNSASQIRAFVERIERLEEEKRTIADDIKDVKAEAKGCGFDTKALNAVIAIRKKGKDKYDEEQSIVDLYLDAMWGDD